MKCKDCPFYGIPYWGAKEPECLVNRHLTDDYPLPCLEEQEEEEKGDAL